MTYQSLLFTLAALGISETAYLIKKRLLAERPVCPLGEDCHIVLTSRYNKLFFVYTDVAGFLFYSITALMVALVVIGAGYVQFLETIIKLLIAAGSAMSVFLTYLQWRIIKAWCFWCLMSACTIWLMAGILVLETVS